MGEDSPNLTSHFHPTEEYSMLIFWRIVIRLGHDSGVTVWGWNKEWRERLWYHCILWETVSEVHVHNVYKEALSEEGQEEY